MNKKQLAEKYKVTVKIFNKWIEPFKDKIGKYNGRTYTPKQIRIIHDCLGEP